jgi:NAD(P)H-binding
MLDTIVGVRRIRRTGRQTAWDIGVSDSTVPDSRWTIVRPTVLTTGPRTGTYRVLVDARDWRSGFISRADVADFLVQQINDARSPVLSGLTARVRATTSRTIAPRAAGWPMLASPGDTQKRAHGHG